MPLEYHETDQVAVAVFPVGIQAWADPELRLPLGHSPSVLFKDNHLAFVGHAELTPSFHRLGLGLRVAPIAVWEASARGSATWFWGTFSSLYPLADGSVVADSDYKSAAADRGEREGGFAARLDLDTKFKAKAGPVIAVVDLELRRHWIHGHRGDLDYTWEPAEMLVIPATAWTFHRTGLLFYEAVKPADPADRKLWLGVMGNWVSCRATDDRNILLGPLAMWKPAPGDAVPTLYIGSQAWLESRNVDPLPPFTFVAANWAR